MEGVLWEEKLLRIESKIIKMMLPHKYPFLLLDRVIELVPGKMAVGIKNVTINEPYFTGHFPTEPIVPGVLILESLAQLTAVLYCSEFFPEDVDFEKLEPNNIDPELIASKVGYLVDIKHVKFKKVVVPGDTITLRVYKKASFGILSQVKAEAFVGRDCVLEGIMSVSQRP